METDVTEDIEGNPIHFRNDNQIKPANTPIGFTSEMVMEYKKCSEDICYFSEKFIFINDPNKGRSKINLYDFQKEILPMFVKEKFVALNTARQVSKTTMASIFIVWYNIFHNDKVSAILANKLQTSRKIFAEILEVYRHLPLWLKPGVKTFNKSEIVFDNGSMIFCSATSMSAIRGYTVSGVLYCDEVAFCPNWADFYASVYPTTSQAKESKIILTSTPKGMNHWYWIVKNAREQKSDFKLKEIYWYQVPGRDEEWKETEIRNTSVEQFSQEQELNFMGSTQSLLSSDMLKSLEFTDPVKTDMGGDIKYYKLPIPGHLYITIVDTAEGLGADYSVVNIFDVTLDNPLKQIEQVCMFRSNMIDQTMLAHVAGRISQEYNNSLCVVENNFGSETAVQLLNEVEYENLYMDDKGVGVRMSKRVKRIGVERLREMITGGLLRIHAIEYLEEFANFIRIKDSWGSDKGYNDDIVMTTVLFAYFTKTDYYKDYAKGDAYREMHKEKIDKLMRADDCPPIIQVGDDGVMSSTTDKDWW